METKKAEFCQKGGEHTFEPMTGLLSGIFCTKCWQEKPEDVLPSQEPEEKK